MTDLTLYSNPMSRGRIARYMLEETGAEYDYVALAYGPEMKSEKYLAINPMGKVPAIVHGDTVVTECAAICAYLADAFPGAGLAPSPGDAARAAYYRWLFFGAGPLEQAVVNRSFGWQVPEGDEVRAGYGSFAQVMDTLEALFADGRPWVLGDGFSGADVYLGAQVAWGVGFGSIEKRPAFEEYAARFNARPAIRRANAADDALMPKDG